MVEKTSVGTEGMNGNEWKDKVKKILSFFLFICLALFLYTRCTYLFREVSCSRDNVTGFEEQGDIDVVCIGASTVVEYFQPLVAWNEYGFTSYDYATLYGQIDLFTNYMDRVLETHQPKLFVIDLRMLTTLSDEVYEQGLRFWTDSLPLFSKERYRSLVKYFDNHPIGEEDDEKYYYLDLAKYHTNTEVLGREANWKYISNKGISQDKGYVFSDTHHFFEKPEIDKESKTELTSLQTKVLYEILDYCKEKELNAFFVVCPYIVPEEDQMVFNTTKDIVESYGYPYINANEYYDEIGLDFSVDMKNINHVNSVGAEKYTLFLGKYIKQCLNIESPTEHISYSSWDNDYIEFRETLEQYKEEVFLKVEEKEKAYSLAVELKGEESFGEWSSGAVNENYSIIVCANMENFDFSSLCNRDLQLLKKWGLTPSTQEKFFRISNGKEVDVLEEQSESIEYSGWIGVIDGLGQVPCKVSMDGGYILSVGNQVFDIDSGSIQFILFDNNFKEIVDSFQIQVDNAGALYMKRDYHAF